jgi:hypothetical protein
MRYRLIGFLRGAVIGTLLVAAFTAGYFYGRKVEQVLWQKAITGQTVDPHVYLLERAWEKIRGR